MADMYTTHLLSMEEVWFVRERPFFKLVIEVKKAVSAVADLEARLEEARKELTSKIDAMNTARKQK